MSVPKMSAKKKLTPSQKDYSLELEFAKKYLKNEVKIEDFPYINSYESTLDCEGEYIMPGKTLVIGCGPLPITMLLSGFTCGLDKSKTAIKYSAMVIDKYMGEASDSCLIHCKADRFKRYGEYNSIIITLEAGDTLNVKRKILNTIGYQMREDAVIIVRSSKGSDFINARKAIDLSTFTILNSFDIFNGLSESIVIKKKN